MDVKRGKKLLLVEDEAIISAVTVKMLSRNGYEVITAKNGTKAVEIASSDNSIDLILMDIDLGAGINGPEAAKQILKSVNIPIVFLTSHSEREIVDTVKEITRYGYVIKNSGDFVLLSSIEMAFELFASHKSLRESADSLRESEGRVRSKLDSIISPEGDIGELELSDIVDIGMFQSLMDDINALTGIAVAVVDLHGTVLASTGWQDICTKFHRKNPDSFRNCIESDTQFARGVDAGTYKMIKCKNNMWDMVTPIEVGGKHVGNLFVGQFLFDDEEIDYVVFRSQARRYGFNEKEYIAALESLPRYGRDEVHTAMTYYIKLSNIISRLSYSNIKLAKTLSERDHYSDLHRESELKLSNVTDYMVDLVVRLDSEGFFKYVSPSCERILGYRPEELMGTWAPEIFNPSTRNDDINAITGMCLAGEGTVEFMQRHKDRSYRWFEATGRNIYDAGGILTGSVIGGRDITAKKIAEKRLSKKNKQYKDLFDNLIDGFALHEIVVDEWGNPADYIFLEVNPAFERYTGLVASEITGRRVRELMPDIEPYWIETYGQVAFTGIQLTIENFSRTLNKWFKVSAYSPERGFFATVFEDITDRKKSEELIKERDERYRRLFDSVIGYVYTVYIMDKSPVKTVHGPGCEAVTGYTPDDFISDPELWYKMIYPDDRGRVILFASDIINKGVFNPIEHRITCRDGSLLWVRNTPVPRYDDSNNLYQYDSIIADITERKLAEISLKESEALFSKAFYNGPHMMIISDFETGRCIEVNDNFCNATGYSRFELINKMPSDITPPENDVRDSLLRDLLKYGNVRGKVIKIKTRNGEFKNCLYYGEIITVQGKKALLSIVEDISFQKSVENKLRERDSMLWNIINSLPDYIYVKDADLKLVLCNDVYASALNKRTDEIIGNTDIESGWGEEFVKGNIEKGIRGYEQDDLRVLAGEKVSVYKEPGYVRGKIHYFDTVKIPIYKNRKVIALVGISRDITERVASDKERAAIIDLLKIINTSNDMHDFMKTVIVYMKSWSGCEAVAIRLRDGDDYPYFETEGFSDRFIKKESTLCAYDAGGEVLRDEKGDPVLECMCGNILRGRFDASKSFFSEHGSFWSNCTTDLLKTTTDEERQARTRNRCNSVGYESVALIPLRVGDNTFGLIQLNDKRKSMFTEELIVLFERLGDNIAVALSEKIARKNLEESESRYRLITERNPASILLVRDGKYLYANRAAADRMGFKSSEEIAGMKIENFISREEIDELKKRAAAAANGAINTPMELTITRPDGISSQFESISMPITLSDGPAALIMGKDITGQKKAMESLSESENRFRKLFEHIPVAYQSLDAAGYIIDVNDRWLDMTGFSREDIMGKSFGDLWTAETKKLFREKFTSFLKTGIIDDAEIPLVKKDGSAFTVILTGRVQFGINGEIERTHCIIIDISSRKVNEDILRERGEFISGVLNSLPSHIAVLDEKGRIIAFNDAWEKFAGELGGDDVSLYSGDNYLNAWKDSFIDDDEISVHDILNGIQAVMHGETGQFAVEYPFRSSQNRVWIKARLTKFTGKNPYYFVVAHEDITIRKDAEEKIESLLKEKELLLREVHHRIKNNMNTISGLLMLQASSMKDEAAATALNDARGRVQGMMLMYDKLYRSEDYRKMQAKEYLEQFIDDIFAIFEKTRLITVEKDIEDFIIDTKILFPVGIIINELITNAFKYAFPGGREGVIKVSVRKDGDAVVIFIKDNGVGISAEMTDSGFQGFGLNLVNALAEQFAGVVKITNDKGTGVEIKFIPVS